MLKQSVLLAALVLSGCATVTDLSGGQSIAVHAINEQGVAGKIGTIIAHDTPAGLALTVQLAGLPAGTHGFHVHENGSCQPGLQNGKMVAGLAAGGHYDPTKSGAHQGPHGSGHLGDLPALQVSADGVAQGTVIAPRLKVADLRGRAIMIHAGGDNYADQPAALGGGGARIACGVVPQ